MYADIAAKVNKQLSETIRILREKIEKDEKQMEKQLGIYIDIRTENMQLLDIVVRLAAIKFPGRSDEPGLWITCNFCHQEIEQDPNNHTTDCLWVEARKIVEERKVKK